MKHQITYLNNLLKRINTQSGETQLGLLIIAIIIGCIIAVGSFATGYVSDTMHERGRNNKAYFESLVTPAEPDYSRPRTVKGYSVVVD